MFYKKACSMVFFYIIYFDTPSKVLLYLIYTKIYIQIIFVNIILKF